MLTHAAEELLSTVQVLAEVLSVLAVSCYSGFWRPIVKMTGIPQGLGKPVSHWMFSAKKRRRKEHC